MHESVLAFRKRRYLWLAIAICAVSIIAYWWYDPQEPPNGGTPLGYTLGTLAAVLIAWLALFGIRKRRYASTLGSVQGWLSAHIYLGLALVVVVFLHSGFQVGWNVHTLALALMLLVIASGVYGIVVYMRYPQKLSENRDGQSRSELLDQLVDIDRRSRRVAEGLGAEFVEFVTTGIQRTQLGATLWERMRRHDSSQILIRQGGETKIVANAGQEAALDWLADQQSRAGNAATSAGIGELSALIRNKRRLLRQIAEDLRMQATLELWLYVHVPLTAALLMAVAAHILVVFLYW